MLSCMENTRRDALKKIAVGGAAAWTAPAVLSSPAFAQGTPPSCDFTIQALGFNCRPNGTARVRYRVTNDTASPQSYSGEIQGCATGNGAFSLNSGGSRTFNFVVINSAQPCTLTFIVNQLAGPGGTPVCTEQLDQEINPPCPSGGPGQELLVPPEQIF